MPVVGPAFDVAHANALEARESAALKLQRWARGSLRMVAALHPRCALASMRLQITLT